MFFTLIRKKNNKKISHHTIYFQFDLILKFYIKMEMSLKHFILNASFFQKRIEYQKI